MSKLLKTVHYVQPNPQSSHYQSERQLMEKVVRWHELCLYDCSHKPERLAGNLRRSDAAGLGKGTRSQGTSTERIQTRKQRLTASNFHGLEKGQKIGALPQNGSRQKNKDSQHQTFMVWKRGQNIGALSQNGSRQKKTKTHSIKLSWSGKGGKTSGHYHRMDPDKETKTHTHSIKFSQDTQ